MGDVTAVGATAPVFVPPHTFVAAEGLTTLLMAHVMLDLRQQTLDSQAHARFVNMGSAERSARANKNAETIDHIGDLQTVTAEQTGDTANQQSSDAERTGMGDDIATDKSTSLSAGDVSKLATAVAGAGQAVNSDAVVANNATAQATALITAIAAMYGLKVSVQSATPASSTTGA